MNEPLHNNNAAGATQPADQAHGPELRFMHPPHVPVGNVWKENDAKRQEFPMIEKWFRKFYPRRYAAPGGWGSPRHAALLLSQAAAVTEDHVGGKRPSDMSDKRHDLIVRSALTMTCAGFALIDNDMQYLWVGKDLAEVLLETDPPDECLAADVPLPAGPVVLMLPAGCITKAAWRRNACTIGRATP